MRLTLALLKRKMPPGNIWTGKHRLAHHVFPKQVENMTKRLQIEDRNMLLLRHPFLTPDQEQGSAQAMGKQPNDWMERQFLERAARKVKNSRPMEDTLKHLIHGSSWDPT